MPNPKQSGALRRTLILSTGHLSPRDACHMRTRPDDLPLAFCPVGVSHGSGRDNKTVESGWLLYIPDEKTALDIAADLRKSERKSLAGIVGMALAFGASLVLLDAEGPRLPGLPWHGDKWD